MWKKLGIKNCYYYVKQEIVSSRVITTVSDLIYLWEEVLSNEEAIQRFKTLNPTVIAAEESMLKFILSLVEEPEHNLDLEEKDTDIDLKMSRIMIPKMKYEFVLSRKPAEAVFKEITLPLMMLVPELKHRHDLLCKQLEAKDEEIMEYKLEGFKITRKNVITPKFEREEFKTESTCQIEERLKCNVSCVNNILLEDLNEFYPFYKNVVMPTSVDLLKQGKLSEDNKKPKEVTEEVKSPRKRNYALVPNVPIKRNKTSKKRIF